ASASRHCKPSSGASSSIGRLLCPTKMRKPSWVCGRRTAMGKSLSIGKLRFAVDTGGTFTDLVVAEPDGSLSLHKTATVPLDPVAGVINSLAAAAEAGGE